MEDSGEWGRREGEEFREFGTSSSLSLYQWYVMAIPRAFTADQFFRLIIQRARMHLGNCI